MTALLDSLPDNEAERIEAVRRYDILDSPPDATFDRITAMAARLLHAPVAVLTFVDVDRIWFKSSVGLDGVSEVARGPGFCASAVVVGAPRIVPDATLDDEVSDHALVTGAFGLRFYLGVPLTTADGFSLGTLCVIDFEPRIVSDDDVANLRDLTAIVMDELELRRDARGVAQALQRSLLPPRPPTIPGMDLATRYVAGERSLEVGGDFFDVFRLATNDWGVMLGDACGRGARPAGLAALVRWTLRGCAVREFSPSAVLRDVNTTIVAENTADADDWYCSAVFARIELDTCGAWLTMANAGHPAPVLVRKSGKVESRAAATLPLGLFQEIDPIDDRVGLGPGDSLVFYTDGITEARDRSGEMFGDDRLRAELLLLSGAPCDDVAAGVLNAAQRFAAQPLSDDVAVVVVRVPDDAGADPLLRVASATGVSIDELDLPGYPHGS